MKHIKTYEKFEAKTVFGMAPLIEVLSTLLDSKFHSMEDVLELIETHDHCTYLGNYISKLNNIDKKELVDLIEAKIDSNTEFILDIEMFDLCVVLATGGRDLHIDVSDVTDRETLHYNYMKLYNKYSTEKE